MIPTPMQELMATIATPPVLGKLAAERNREAAQKNILADALWDLVEAVPNEPRDADWWPDELRFAMDKARKALTDVTGEAP